MDQLPTKFENLILMADKDTAYTVLAKYRKSRYEHRMVIPYEGDDIPFKVSDVHIEVDMHMLGCTPRQLWVEIISHVNRMPMVYIILCINFHMISKDLLDVFHTFMNNRIKYLIVSDGISFIPTNLLSRCRMLGVPRTKSWDRDAEAGHKLADLLLQAPSAQTIRDELYAICIKGMTFENVVLAMCERLQLPHDRMVDAIVNTMPYFNNNYRPIYHMEHLVTNLICLINEKKADP